jgi:NAD(P)-dependent dehydrogenase (short-subunit alcohol dehydrogenase family)
MTGGRTTGVTVVTGGTRGIGRAIVERVAGDGVKVAAVFRSGKDAAEALVAYAAEHDLPISTYRADLSSADECRAVIQTIRDEQGPIDRLVNNAGVLIESKVRDVTVDEWDTIIDTNLRSAFLLSQAVWDPMVENGFGRIVNIGSVTATSGNPVEVAYGASKAGLVGMTRSLAMAGARKGITVNCVVPGVYATDMTASMSEEAQRRIAAMIPIGRHGRPEELAHMVHALLDERASYVTGAVIMADGGLGMGA